MSSNKKTLLLKEQMNNNKEITAIIEEIKSLQKEYVKSKDIKIKKILSYLFYHISLSLMQIRFIISSCFEQKFPFFSISIKSLA